jgi:hypothetical protein
MLGGKRFARFAAERSQHNAGFFLTGKMPMSVRTHIEITEIVPQVHFK